MKRKQAPRVKEHHGKRLSLTLQEAKDKAPELGLTRHDVDAEKNDALASALVHEDGSGAVERATFIMSMTVRGTGEAMAMEVLAAIGLFLNDVLSEEECAKLDKYIKTRGGLRGDAHTVKQRAFRMRLRESLHLD